MYTDPTHHLDEELINRYLDGDLDDSHARLVVEHTSHCRICSARVDEVRALFQLLATVVDEPYAVDLAPRVLADITLSTPSEQVLLSWRTLVLQGIVTLLVLLLTWPSIRLLQADLLETVSIAGETWLDIQSRLSESAAVSAKLWEDAGAALSFPAMLPTMPDYPVGWLSAAVAASALLWFRLGRRLLSGPHGRYGDLE